MQKNCHRNFDIIRLSFELRLSYNVQIYDFARPNLESF